MDAEEFAEAHGLSVDEARLILSLRSKPKPAERLRKAMEALTAAQRKTGVIPVVAVGEILKKEET